MELVGKRAVFIKHNCWVGTILKADVFEDVIRYTVHFDGQPKTLRHIVLDDRGITSKVVIIGKVFAGGSQWQS